MADSKKKRPARGRDVKKRKYVLLEVEPDTYFRVKRGFDLPGMFTLDLLPLPLVGAVERLQTVRRAWRDDDPGQALALLSGEDKKAFMELLRTIALRVVVEPKLTDSKKASLADEDLLWVGGYSDVPGETIDDQMRAGQPAHELEGDVSPSALMTLYRFVLGEGGITIMPDDEATEFRPEVEAQTDRPSEDGREVRTEAAFVDSHAGDQETPAVVPPAVVEPPKVVEFIPIG